MMLSVRCSIMTHIDVRRSMVDAENAVGHYPGYSKNLRVSCKEQFKGLEKPDTRPFLTDGYPD